MFRSWRALIVREYLEHRVPALYFPLGILGLFTLSAVSGVLFNKLHLASDFALGSTLKIFELGYLVLMVLWFAYFAVALFFYFGDAFSADRRNNAMLFWKSMPVSDLKIMVSKFLAGLTLFPLIILVIGAVSGLLFYLVFNIAVTAIPNLVPPPPDIALRSFGHITAFAVAYLAHALLWYAPFLDWVGGLSTVFGRWSLPLAFVIPGLLAVVENLVAFGHGPRGGYVWNYLAQRWQFGLTNIDYGFLAVSPQPFDATYYIPRLASLIDWTAMVVGLVFAGLVIWLASEYRRRRIA